MYFLDKGAKSNGLFFAINSDINFGSAKKTNEGIFPGVCGFLQAFFC